MSNLYRITIRRDGQINPSHISAPLCLDQAARQVEGMFGVLPLGEGRFRFQRDGEFENVDIVPTAKFQRETIGEGL